MNIYCSGCCWCLLIYSFPGVFRWVFSWILESEEGLFVKKALDGWDSRYGWNGFLEGEALGYAFVEAVAGWAVGWFKLWRVFGVLIFYWISLDES